MAGSVAVPADKRELLLSDLIVAECVDGPDSFYEFASRAGGRLERLDFAEAYLVAQAEATGVGGPQLSLLRATVSHPCPEPAAMRANAP